MAEITRAGNRVRVTVEIVNSLGEPQRMFPAVHRVYEFHSRLLSGSHIGARVMGFCGEIEAHDVLEANQPPTGAEGGADG